MESINIQTATDFLDTAKSILNNVNYELENVHLGLGSSKIELLRLRAEALYDSMSDYTGSVKVIELIEMTKGLCYRAIQKR